MVTPPDTVNCANVSPLPAFAVLLPEWVLPVSNVDEIGAEDDDLILLVTCSPHTTHKPSRTVGWRHSSMYPIASLVWPFGSDTSAELIRLMSRSSPAAAARIGMFSFLELMCVAFPCEDNAVTIGLEVSFVTVAPVIGSVLSDVFDPDSPVLSECLVDNLAANRSLIPNTAADDDDDDCDDEMLKDDTNGLESSWEIKFFPTSSLLASCSSRSCF
jgi:hypothetical protein